MKLFVAAIMVALLGTFAAAQKVDNGKDALNAVEKMFDEMAAHNPANIVSAFTKEAQLVALIKTKDGKTVTHILNGEAFSKNFAVKKGELKELMYKPSVEAFGDLVLIHGRYVFFVDGKISHCGVNAFHMVKTEAGWKIANAASTIDPKDCSEKEKKMQPTTK